jgi:polysaccharide export outer membrane protein
MKKPLMMFGGLTLLSLGGCIGTRPLQSSDGLRVVDAQSLQPPSRADLTVKSDAYTIGALDELDITVLGLPEISRKVRVDAAGNVALPIAGTVSAVGLTPAELTANLEAALRRGYVRYPQVAVNVTDIVSQTATIDGEVKKPGNYPVVGDSTLLRFIAQAEGATQYARLSDVVVFRTVNGQKMAALYNVKAIRNGAYQDPQVYPHDVIVVGDSPARRLFNDIVGAGSLISTPLVILLTRRSN